MSETEAIYFLFAYTHLGQCIYRDHLYPNGGMGDYKGSYPTLQAAKDAFEALPRLDTFDTMADIATLQGRDLVIVEEYYDGAWQQP